MGNNLNDWTRKQAPWWSPGTIAQGQRRIVAQLLAAHRADVLSSQDTLATQVAAIYTHLSDTPEAVIALHEIKALTLEAAKKRERRQQAFALSTSAENVTSSDTEDEGVAADFPTTSAQIIALRAERDELSTELAERLDGGQTYLDDDETIDRLHAIELNLTSLNLLQDEITQSLKQWKTKKDTYTPTAAKDFEHQEAGFWAAYYTTKTEELGLLRAVKSLDISDTDLAKARNLIKLQSVAADEATKEAHLLQEEASIRECSKLALRKHKDADWLPLFYTGKAAYSLTALGAGISGAMVAMFVATTFLGLPLVAAAIGALIVFLIHFVLEIKLNRFTTARTLWQIFRIGIFDESDPETPDPYAKRRVLIPLILCAGTGIQVGMLTAVGTMTIFAGLASGSILLPIAAAVLGILGFMTVGTLLFHHSYKIYKAPEAWWQDNLDKLPEENSAEHLLQLAFTAIAGIIVLGAIGFYCFTIVTSVFTFCPPLGWAICVGLNVPAMLPFLITASFDVGQWITDQTAWILQAYPEHPKTAPLLLAFLAFITIPLWAPVAAFRGLTSNAQDAKHFLQGEPSLQKIDSSTLEQHLNDMNASHDGIPGTLSLAASGSPGRPGFSAQYTADQNAKDVDSLLGISLTEHASLLVDATV